MTKKNENVKVKPKRWWIPSSLIFILISNPLSLMSFPFESSVFWFLIIIYKKLFPVMKIICKKQDGQQERQMILKVSSWGRRSADQSKFSGSYVLTLQTCPSLFLFILFCSCFSFSFLQIHFNLLLMFTRKKWQRKMKMWKWKGFGRECPWEWRIPVT